MALPTAFLVGPVASAEPGEEPVAGQLRALGYDVVDTSTAPDLVTAISAAPAGPVALVDRRYIGHLHALRRAVCDARPDALAGPGTLTVAHRARPHLVSALASVPAASSGSGTRPDGDAIDVAHVADVLARRLSVTRLDPAPLVAGLADTAEERAALQARMAAVDEERVRLTTSVKSGDTAFTTFAVRPYSGHVARWLARLRVTPNQVTLASLLVGLGAAASCATGTRLGWVLGALLFHLSFVLDCVDGDLARYTVRFSQLGARLDLTADRVKEYALFAGLALGVASTDGAIWWLAGAAMALQTLRHHMHFAWDAVTAGLDEAPPLAAQVQARLRGGRWKVWLRRAVVLPQGERSALICLLVALTTPRTVFVVLLAVGVLATAYAFLGRLLRSLRRVRNPWSKTAGRSLGAMIDVGPVGWLVHNALPGRSLPAPLTTFIALIVLAFSLVVVPTVGGSWVIVGVLWYALLVGFASQQPLNGWADWVLPPSFRSAEYTLVLALAALWEPRALPVAFVYVAVCAFHHYDTVYRLRADGDVPPRWLVIATGGHDGRMLVVALLALLGSGVFHVGLVALTAALAVLFVSESVHATAAAVRAAKGRTPQGAA
jgi:phosphatidylglycerophosphate synthase